MKLETYIKSKEISPEEFAALIGCSKDAVYKWLSGGRKPRDEETMQRIFELTGGAVTANDFYGIETSPPQPPKDTLTQAYNGVY